MSFNRLDIDERKIYIRASGTRVPSVTLRTPLPIVGALRKVIYTSIRVLTQLCLAPPFLANCLLPPAGALAGAKSFSLKSKKLSRNRLGAIASPQNVNPTFQTSHCPPSLSYQIATVINSALDLYFPEGCGVDILARLGRYYVTSAFTLAVSIIAKKEVLLDQPGREGRWQVGNRAPFFPLDTKDSGLAEQGLVLGDGESGGWIVALEKLTTKFPHPQDNLCSATFSMHISIL